MNTNYQYKKEIQNGAKYIFELVPAPQGQIQFGLETADYNGKPIKKMVFFVKGPNGIEKLENTVKTVQAIETFYKEGKLVESGSGNPGSSTFVMYGVRDQNYFKYVVDLNVQAHPDAVRFDNPQQQQQQYNTPTPQQQINPTPTQQVAANAPWQPTGKLALNEQADNFLDAMKYVNDGLKERGIEVDGHAIAYIVSTINMANTKPNEVNTINSGELGLVFGKDSPQKPANQIQPNSKLDQVLKHMDEFYDETDLHRITQALNFLLADDFGEQFAYKDNIADFSDFEIKAVLDILENGGSMNEYFAAIRS